MPLLIGLVAVVAGILNAVQSGTNAALNKALAQPVAAALVVTATSAIVYLLACPVLGLGWPGTERIARTPWWAWIGGALGAVYVLSAIVFAERLGAAVFTGLTVTAGIVTSIVLDHFGWVGFQQHAAGPWRIAGGLVMIGGLLLVSLT